MSNQNIYQYPINQTIYNLVNAIVPFDSIEEEHILDTL